MISKWKPANKIANFILKTQTAFAGFMNKSFHTRYRLKLLFIAICIFGGGFSLFLVIDALTGKKRNSIHVQPIRLPVNVHKNGSEINEPVMMVTDEMYFAIQHYKRYMVSTGQTMPSILLDSIIVLESIYHQQK